VAVHLVNELVSSLECCIKESVENKDAAVAFSGGLDSGIIAVISKRYGNVTLYTVGVEEAYDVKAARYMAETVGIRWKHIEITEEDLEKEIPNMIRVTRTINPITISFEVPAYFVLKHAVERTVLTGQGADELFVGYSKYIGLSEEEFAATIRDDMAELMNVTLAHERSVAEHFGKNIIHPYLDRRIVDFVNSAGISGVSEGDVRKPLLRDVARSLGQPELAERPKKAAQYGSGTMAVMRSMAKKRKMTVREMISSMAEDI